MATREQAIQKLISYAKGSSHKVDMRLAAVEALGYAGGDAARDTLIKIMSEGPGADMKLAAARALGHAASRD